MLTATLDSPDQGANGIIITSITYTEPDLHFAIDKLGAGYDGKLDVAKQEITGVWKQGSNNLPLNLTRGK